MWADAESAPNTTPDYTSAIEEVRNHAEELERRLDVIATSAAPTISTPQFRSFGDWVKAVAAGNDDALALHRTFTGADSADSIMKNAWVSDTVRILNAGRPTFNVLSSAALPADGMNVEYPKVNTNTLAVAEQAAEGDALAYGKLTLTSQTAPIKTYGGYTDMSRQVVERSSINYVDTAFRAMVAKYAAQTNAAVRAKLISEAANFNTSALGAWTATEIIDSLAEAATKVNVDTGLHIVAYKRPDTRVDAKYQRQPYEVCREALKTEGTSVIKVGGDLDFAILQHIFLMDYHKDTKDTVIPP